MPQNSEITVKMVSACNPRRAQRKKNGTFQQARQTINRKQRKGQTFKHLQANSNLEVVGYREDTPKTPKSTHPSTTTEVNRSPGVA